MDLSVEGKSERIPPGSHILQLYNKVNEISGVTAKLLEVGLTSDEKCLFAGASASCEEVEQALTRAGVNVAAAQETGQLVFVSERDLLLVGVEDAGAAASGVAPHVRGRGYASAMLASALDDAKAGGHDLAYLFSDIHPQFYKTLGFIEMPSRSISVRADSLQNGRLATEPVTERDWTAIRRCFDSMESHREWMFERSPIVWDWIRLRLRQSSEFAGGQPVNLAVRRGRTVVAYLFARRETKHDSLVADEFGFADAFC